MKRVLGIVSLGLLVTFVVGGGCGSVIDPQAEQQLRAKLGTTSATVFPAFLRNLKGGDYDESAVATLKAFLEDQKLATVTASAARVPLTGKAGVNQAAMCRESLAEFTAWLKDHPVDTDYAVLPEYLIDGQGRGIGVHLYVLARDGKCAYAMVINSHHEPFQKVRPQNPADCTRVVIDILKKDWTVANTD